MEITRKLYGKGLITFLLIVFRSIFLLGSIALIIMGIYGILALFVEVAESKSIFPVLFSITKEGILNNPGDLGSAEFNLFSGMGLIVVDEISTGFKLLFDIILFLSYACSLFYLKLVIKILEAADEGGFLIVENAKRLRWIALLGIAIYLLGFIATLASSFYFNGKLELINLEFTNFNRFSFVSSNSVFNYLFLLVIAEAFRIGALLKKENELTI